MSTNKEGLWLAFAGRLEVGALYSCLHGTELVAFTFGNLVSKSKGLFTQ